MHPFRLGSTNLLVTLGISATIASASSLVVAQQPEHVQHKDHLESQYGHAVASSTPAAQRKAAAESTEQIINAQKQWAMAQGASGKASALQNLIGKVEQRQQVLIELIKNNPEDAFRYAIPNNKQAGMPAAVLDMLEQTLEIEGELETFYADYEDGSHKLSHFLNTPFGERFELHAPGAKLQLPNGSKIRAHGLLLSANSERNDLDGYLALDSKADSLVTLAAGGDNSNTQEVLAALPGTFGEQKTAVILVNFQDDTSQPWTVDQVRDEVFNQTNNHIQENSYQQTWLNGDVFGWHTLPLSSSSCDHNAIASAAREAAQNSGINVSGYDRQVFIFPRLSSCGWAGLGTVGGSPSTTWINGSMRWKTISHELGHNFGLYHSHSLECGSVVIGNTCSTYEYGDTTGVMGSASAHFNAFQKELLGWLDASSITTISNSGTFDLDTYATSEGGAPKALKVLKGTDAVTGDKTWYYLQYRRPSGYDSGLNSITNTSEGVVISTGSDSSRNTSYLLDMTPETSSWYDPALAVGQQYYDGNAGVDISTNWVDASSASVTIDMAPQSCAEQSPALSASPVQSEWIAAGTSFSYSITVTNRNSLDCGTSSFNLSMTKPSGWSANFDSTSVSLAPGESRTVGLTVISTASAADGFYNINASATAGANSGSVALTYVVSNPVGNTNSSPVADNDSVVISSKSPVTIAVLDNDWDPDGDSLSLLSVTQGAKGNVAINSDGTLTYTPGKRFKNSDSFTYSISDGGKTASASVSIQLQSSGDTGDTGGNGGNKGNGKKR
ncbi:Ig-like domain-containing protein [Amphritea sp. HPY]|uniref:Ig-like domain-containing protein n=1 Tax=Amphritea sp. HPY TaxID=3421652 RepID=UPI003D7E38E2